MTKLWTTAAPAFRESGDWPRQGLRSGQDRRSRPARRNLERAMAVAVVPREDNAFANDNPPPARNAVLAFCRDYLSRRPRRRHHGSRHLPRPARRRFLVAAVACLSGGCFVPFMSDRFRVPATRSDPSLLFWIPINRQLSRWMLPPLLIRAFG